MTIEDVADKADVWSEAIKKIVKAITAAGVALAVAIGGLLAWWPFGETDPPPPPALIQNAGYSPQCSQLYSALILHGLKVSGLCGKNLNVIWIVR